jgi:hypothetical protein
MEKLPDSYYINQVQEDRRKGIYASYTSEFMENYIRALKNEIELLKQEAKNEPLITGSLDEYLNSLED